MKSGLMTTSEIKHPKSDLSQEEVKGIFKRIENEKLALDVHLKFYEHWKLPLFKKIANIELEHTKSINLLFATYRLTDKTGKNYLGGFNQTTMQDLYKEYLQLGTVSPSEALKVSIKIEEIALNDLNYQLLEVVKHKDIKEVYETIKQDTEAVLQELI